MSDTPLHYFLRMRQYPFKGYVLEVGGGSPDNADIIASNHDKKVISSLMDIAINDIQRGGYFVLIGLKDIEGMRMISFKAVQKFKNPPITGEE